MSRYEEDDCEVNLQLRLREINRKAKANTRTDVECGGLECTELSYAEILHEVNSTDSEHNDVIRNRIVQELIDNDFEDVE